MIFQITWGASQVGKTDTVSPEIAFRPKLDQFASFDVIKCSEPAQTFYLRVKSTVEFISVIVSTIGAVKNRKFNIFYLFQHRQITTFMQNFLNNVLVDAC